MAELESFVEVVNPEQPHLATVLLLDVSGSMAENNKIGQLRDGLRDFKKDLLDDDLARKRVDLAVVTFGNTVRLVQDFSSVETFEPPNLQANGDTPMGQAILQALEMVEERKGEYKNQGIDYYRPWVFLLTDGEPTDMIPGYDDMWNDVVSKIHEGEAGRHFLFFAVGVEPASMDLLSELAPPERPPVRLKARKFKEMFEWLSKSLGGSGVSGSAVGDQVTLDSPVGWAQISTT